MNYVEFQILHDFVTNYFQFPWKLPPIKHKNLAKLVKIQNPVNPGFEAQKTNPDF